MQKLNCEVNQTFVNKKEEIISFKCELHENLQQALKNFNRRLNIDHNGYNHPELEYVFNPMRVITRDVVGDDSKSNETILSFNCKKLDERILKEVEQWT